MGCCISTTKAPKTDPDHHHHHHHHQSPPKPDNKSHVSNDPLPSLEEETVKEVLSETPISKPQPTSTIQEEKLKKMEDFSNQDEEISEITQASETASFSTTTTTTTTTTTIREDEAMSKQSKEVSNRVNTSPAKVPRKRPYSGDVGVAGGGGRERGAKSPAGRGRERNVGSTGVRRDFRDGSGGGRSSRSPATRKSGGVGRGGRGGSQVKVTGKAGGRLVGGVDVEGGINEEVKNEGVLQQQGNESLENPLVSLECFIFL